MTLESYKKTLGKNIARLRNNRGLTQTELANNLHLSRTTVANWEQGKCSPAGSQLVALAEYFNINPDTLIDVSDPTADPEFVDIPDTERTVPTIPGFLVNTGRRTEQVERMSNMLFIDSQSRPTNTDADNLREIMAFIYDEADLISCLMRLSDNDLKKVASVVKAFMED